MNWAKIMTSLNVFVYQASNGRLGSRMGRQSMLVLHTIGRKTGKRHAATLAYYRDGVAYLVVGSNWGKEQHPAWYLNLMHEPRTTIQVKDTVIQVEAQDVTQEEEYRRLWEFIARQNSQYTHYQKGINRRIPIVRLLPVP